MRILLIVVLALVACREHEVSPEELKGKLATATPGEEVEVSKGIYMAMYRSQVVSPVAGGWNQATSTKGGFSVELPVPFNDFRSRSTADDGVELASDVIGGKTTGALSWMATCLRRPDGKRAEPATDKTERLGDPVRAWQRTVPVPGGLCILVVEAQGTDRLPGEADIQRFLRSFKAAP